MPEFRENICPVFMAASKIIRELIIARDPTLTYHQEEDIDCMKDSCAVWDDNERTCSLKRAYKEHITPEDILKDL
jgi:hypothetical protein